jgi:serine/threonine protein kinase
MRLVPGRQLREELDEYGLLPLERALRITEQMCAGISAAHLQNVVHCDLKPENILLERVGGNNELVQLVDFGIARLRGLNITSSTATTLITDSAIGTPYYMSPEQCCGEPLTHHTDIYSLAIILFEMLTGRVPFKSPYPADVASHHVHTPPSAPSLFQPRISAEIDRVILRALSKYPSQRQQTALEFLQELSQATGLQLSLANITNLISVSQQSKSSTLELKLENEFAKDRIRATKSSFTRHTSITPSTTNRYFDPILKSGAVAKPATIEQFPHLSTLVIDSSAITTNLIITTLQEFDCLTTTAQDEYTAWQQLEQHHFDLVICDTHVPTVNSWEMVAKAQQLVPPPLFIFMTNNASDDERLLALEQGVEDYWLKPFVVAELRVRLKRLLQRLSAKPMNRGRRCGRNRETFDEHYALALSYIHQAEWQAAIGHLQMALDKLGTLPLGALHFRCYYEIGLCYQELGAAEQAREWYYRALTVPNFSIADHEKIQQALFRLL